MVHRPGASRITTWGVVAFLSAAVFALTCLMIFSARDAADWASVQGRILRSAYAIGCGRGQNQPYPDVRYEYRYENRTYIGTRVARDTDHCGWASTAQEVAGHYKPGEVVPVFVNPQRPSQAALVVGDAQSGTMITLLISALTFTVAVMNIIGAMRERRRIQNMRRRRRAV
jgi:hypothetical protein